MSPLHCVTLNLTERGAPAFRLKFNRNQNARPKVPLQAPKPVLTWSYDKNVVSNSDVVSTPSMLQSENWVVVGKLGDLKFEI